MTGPVALGGLLVDRLQGPVRFDRIRADRSAVDLVGGVEEIAIGMNRKKRRIFRLGHERSATDLTILEVQLVMIDAFGAVGFGVTANIKWRLGSNTGK